MPLNLTDAAIRKALRGAVGGVRRDLVDGACRGLRLRPGRQGTATWSLACRDRFGRMRRYSIGAYPHMGISDARKAATALYAKIKFEGYDPVAEQQHRRQASDRSRSPTSTLQALIEVYGGTAGKQRKGWSEYQRRIETVFRKVLNKPLPSLTTGELQIIADSYPAIMSASAATRYLRPILKWAAQRAYVDAKLAEIHAPATIQRRKRVLSRQDLAKVLPALKAANTSHCAAMYFMLLTLARREEVANAKWQDMSLDKAEWTIPVTKNGEPHVVPLSKQALNLILRRRLIAAEPESLIFASSSGGHLSNWDRETKRIQRNTGVSGWHRHDLRRTGATMLGELGELPDIIEAALNHVSIRSPLAATYNRSRYRPQVAVALQRLADGFDKLAIGSV